MTLSIAVVCEARADFETGCGLADRILRNAADWIADNSLRDFRTYRGEAETEPFLTWREVPQRFKALGLSSFHGRFEDRSRISDYRPAQSAILLLQKAQRVPDAILLLRDDDRETARADGLRKAIEEAKKRGAKMPIVIGLAHTKRECWVLAGFVANTPQERERLDHLRRELGFDPCRESTRLNDKGDGEPRSAKRVLRELTQDDREREACCWLDTPFEVLRDQGRDTGLAEFLAELQDKLVPLFV